MISKGTQSRERVSRSDLNLKKIGEKTRDKNRRVYMGFMDLEKACYRVNKEALWQVLRIYSLSFCSELCTF